MINIRQMIAMFTVVFMMFLPVFSLADNEVVLPAKTWLHRVEDK